MQLLNLLFLLAPASRIIWDWYTIEVKKKGIDYFKHNTVTAIMMVGSTLLLHSFLGARLSTTFFLMWGFYEIFFDYGLNFFRNKPVLTYFGDFTDIKNLSFIEAHVYAKMDWKDILGFKVLFFALTLYFHVK